MQSFTAVLLSLALLATVSQASYWLSCHDYEEAYRAIDELISHKPYLIPPLVRLAFHDCYGHSCDGCLNFEDSAHKGLADPIKEIDHLWEDPHWDFRHHFSRSDWWQLASHIALIRGGLNRHDGHKDFFYLQYWWGRKDCHTSPWTHADDDLPDASKDFHEVWKSFHGVFGLDYEESVALMGAHSLGGAHSEYSGYKFNWQKNYLTFDNTYFKNLVYLPYTHEDQSEGDHHEPHKAFVWYPHDHHQEPLLMLHTDMCLWKDIKSLSSSHDEYAVACYLKSGEPSVIPDEHDNFVAHCQDAYTSDIVYHYAHDLKDFYSKFSHAWWKVVSHGFEHDYKLQLPGNEHEQCGHCIPHGAYCVPGFELSGSCCHGSSCIDHKCQ